MDSAQLHAVPAASPLAALAGKVAGARVVTISGEPGTPVAVLLRNAAVNRITDPLIVVDGVVSRLSTADLNVEDIERIEILKGPAAGAIYGVGAANGVLHIITRSGRDLAAVVTRLALRSELALTQLPRLIPTSTTHHFLMNNAGTDFALDANGNRIRDPDRFANNPYPRSNAPAGALVAERAMRANYFAASHRFPSTGVVASLQHQRDEGVMHLARGFTRRNARLKLDHDFTDKVAIGGSAFASRSNGDASPLLAGHLASLRMIEPQEKLDSVVASCATGVTSCYVPTVRAGAFGVGINPLHLLQQTDVRDERERTNGALFGTYRPSSWLTARVGYAADRSNQKYRAAVNGFPGPGGTFGPAFSQNADRADRVSTSSATLTSVRSLRWSGLRNTTQLGWIDEKRSWSVDTALTGGLAPPPPIGGTHIESKESTKSLLLATAFEHDDRFVLDAAVRRDKLSEFAPPRDKAVFHRLGAGYLAPGNFKFRVAHGTSAVPLSFEQFFFSGASNSRLRMPFVRETEYGVEAGFMGKYSLAYNYARQRTSSHVMLVPTPASLGFTMQWQNIGRLAGRTHELTLGASVLSAADHAWRVNVTAHRARATVEDQLVPAFVHGSAVRYLMQAGERLGTMYGVSWIRSDAQLAETIRSGQLTGTVADYERNVEGFYVRKSQHRTIFETPLASVSCPSASPCSSFTQIGDANPDLELGISSDARFKTLSAHATLSWVQGGDIYNFARRSSFALERDEAYDQSRRPAAERKPAAYYLAFLSLGGVSDYFVERGTYVKLREVAIEWTVPERWWSRLPLGAFDAAHIGVVGRNLWTWSRYSGFDPDIAAGSASVFDSRVDRSEHPAYRTLGLSLKLGY